MTEISEILPVNIEDEMQKSYLDYAMSVIVSRAIPDARDGLKPVHRRILYAMHESRCDYNRPYRKSARIVGDVMGKYHPHGDTAIYDSLVRMAQPFSLRVPLIDGQGNFGSMDGDSPAAMRYTESRMAKIAHTLLSDIDKNTVSFQPNYDGSEHEPTVLPARFPNLLVNGSGGIAVGMATNVPPFNLGEVIDGCCAYIDNPNETTAEDIFKIIPGPDFPTGGLILGSNGSYGAVTTGRGSVIIRAKTHFEEFKPGRTAIIVTEMPYQVNKAKMVEKIAELVRDKRVEGISDLRDESNKQGVRVAIELKRDAIPEVVLNQLFRYTPLQTSFGSNILALDNGRPKVMSVFDVIKSFVKFREEVITRRTKYLLSKTRDKAHILIGLAMAVANIDEVIRLIKASPDTTTARIKLMERSWDAEEVIPLLELVADHRNVIIDGKCQFTETQARAILDMKLSRLTGLEKGKIDNELKELAVDIKKYLTILGSHEKLMSILRNELIEVKEEFANDRRSEFVESEFEHDIEDLIAKEDMVVTVTMGGYIKRVPLSTYRAQNRGGKGRSGMAMYEEDITTSLYVANTHTPMLFFSNIGKVYKLKVYRLPQGSPQSKGRALVNIFPLQEGETITNIMAMPDDEDTWDNLNMMFSTASGNIRRSDMSDFKLVQSNGKIAIRLEDGDSLVAVQPAANEDHVLLASHNGKCIRFQIESLRVIKSRTSIGVRGINLEKGDKVISMAIINGIEATTEERDAYLRIPLEQRLAIATFMESENDSEANDIIGNLDGCLLEPADIKKFADHEEFLLTVTENGYGKRSSLYEYRITNRGGKGIVNIITSPRNGNVAANFPVKETDQIMLMTGQGKIIRCPVGGIRIAGRNTQGVTIFKTAEKERVVSASLIADSSNNDEDGSENENSNDDAA